MLFDPTSRVVSFSTRRVARADAPRVTNAITDEIIRKISWQPIR
jgi:hypothetical protein